MIVTNFKLKNGNVVLSGYDTEKDMNRAKKDISRVLSVLSMYSLSSIIDILAPYRKRAASRSQDEYEELSERANGETE